MDSQNAEIIRYLQAGGVIEPMLAQKAFGCYRLSARIYDLRSLGFKIATSMEYYTAPNGRRKKYAKYWLKAEDRA